MPLLPRCRCRPTFGVQTQVSRACVHVHVCDARRHLRGDSGQTKRKGWNLEELESKDEGCHSVKFPLSTTPLHVIKAILRGLLCSNQCRLTQESRCLLNHTAPCARAAFEKPKSNRRGVGRGVHQPYPLYDARVLSMPISAGGGEHTWQGRRGRKEEGLGVE